MEVEQNRKIASKYRHGFFITIQLPSKEKAGPEAGGKRLYLSRYKKTYGTISKIEA